MNDNDLDKITVDIEISNLDEAIEKASLFCDLLEKAVALIGSLKD